MTDNLGDVRSIRIEDEMRTSYLDYAMSVIVARALPDVRDGLKPVHRRILYTMGEMGLSATSSFRKCAAIVGEVMGKLHPHGDAAIYDALVRLAQHFSMRYPLIDGQGNFGSVDGDSAAAMRYTEARLTAIAAEMLADIDRATVDFADNYDGQHREPTILPAKLPNLLINGSSGIAVGMATNIPPHHLGEIVDAEIALIDDPELTSDDLCAFVKGPDFPTGGSIFRYEQQKNAITGATETVDAIRQMYAHGHGRVVMRAQVAFEEARRDRVAIIVSELPYQVNKATLLEKIADLVKDKRIEGIADLRDESDRDGMRIYVEIKNDANPHTVLNNLFKHTAMQLAFNLNMLALVDGQPQTLPLKSVIAHHIEHRREIVRRRTEYDLGKARDRAHVLEGLKIALDHLDEVIRTIRESADVETARTNLIARLRALRDPGPGDPRHAPRPPGGPRAQEDRGRVPRRHPAHRGARGHPRQPVARPGHHQGRADRAEAEVRRRAADAGRGRLQPRDDRRGPHRRRGRRRHHQPARLHQAPAGRHLPPPGPRRARGSSATSRARRTRSTASSWPTPTTGRSSSRTGAASSRAKVHSVARRQPPGEGDPDHQPARRPGGGRRGSHGDARRPRLQGRPLPGDGDPPRRDQEDAARAVREGPLLGDPGDHARRRRRAGLGGRRGRPRRRDHRDRARQARPLRRDARSGPWGATRPGVIGIRLARAGDEVVSMSVVQPERDLLVLTETGYGKRVALSEFRRKHRGGQGVMLIPLEGRKTGRVAAVQQVTEADEELLLISAGGQVVRTQTNTINRYSSGARGVITMRLNEGDRVVGIAAFSEGLAERGGMGDNDDPDAGPGSGSGSVA